MHIDSQPSWEVRTGGFRVRQQYAMRLAQGESTLLDANVVFSVDYTSPLPMTNDLFGPFAQRNVPLNTWPYLREYLSSIIGRMNWGMYTLPAFKVDSAGQPLVGNQPFTTPNPSHEQPHTSN